MQWLAHCQRFMLVRPDIEPLERLLLFPLAMNYPHCLGLVGSRSIRIILLSAYNKLV